MLNRLIMQFTANIRKHSWYSSLLWQNLLSPRCSKESHFQQLRLTAPRLRLRNRGGLQASEDVILCLVSSRLMCELPSKGSLEIRRGNVEQEHQSCLNGWSFRRSPERALRASILHTSITRLAGHCRRDMIPFEGEVLAELAFCPSWETSKCAGIYGHPFLFQCTKWESIVKARIWRGDMAFSRHPSWPPRWSAGCWLFPKLFSPPHTILHSVPLALFGDLRSLFPYVVDTDVTFLHFRRCLTFFLQ